MPSFASPSLFRALTVYSSLVFAIACGGSPSVSSRGGKENLPPEGQGGLATGGTDGNTGATGGTGNTGGTINVGGQGQGGEGADGGNPDPCDVANPPPECFMVQPSGPGCGDGEINQAEEECDDGNGLPGDGCSGVCQKEPYFRCDEPGQPCELTIACGDGAVDPGEFCDDGNTDEDDGCSSDCETQDPSYVCPDPGEACTLLYDCGDSRVNGSEECDDGNKNSDDGCSSKCKREDGWVCRRPGKDCELDQYCGDGIIQSSLGEECDDGNPDFGDGCSGVCTIDPYWVCEDGPGEPCTYTIECGNGEREPGEACDDGDDVDDNGCSNDCVQDPAYVCPDEGEPCTKLYECGDGRLHACSGDGCEECDDGDTDDGDGCDENCLIEPGYLCRHPGQDCVLDISCGDGIVQSTTGEVCDDGNDDWDDGCYGDCTVAPYYDCPIEGGDCISTIICGDSKRDPGEACDDGDASGGDGCDSDCYIEPNYRCTGTAGGLSTCTKIQDCGDGKVTAPEECDDGPTRKVSGDGCSSTCQLETGYICPIPGGACTQKIVCGDGKRAASEQCDDGDNDPLDGCSAACKIENDWNCTGAVGAQSACTYTVACGDGKLGTGEVCDDGNTTANDGCSANCKMVETGFKCVRAGSPCVAVCGDGIKKGSEQCDPLPANATACTKCRLNTNYTCGASGLGPCTATACGNAAAKPAAAPGTQAYIDAAIAAAEPGEGCDDKNTIAGDGCGPTCQLEPKVTPDTALTGPTHPTVAENCGDGLVTGTEECDDGNMVANDGCAYIAPGNAGNCKEEKGWNCSESTTYPGSIDFRITYRDFKHRSDAGGHPHMRVSGTDPPNQGTDLGIVGTVCTVANPDACGRLDLEGKPQYAGGTHNTISGAQTALGDPYHKAAFALWYRDTNLGTPAVVGPPAVPAVPPVNDATTQGDGNAGTNTAIVIDAAPAPMPAVGMDTLVLGRQGVTPAYQFSNNANTFYPLGSASTTNPFTERGFGYTPGFSGTARRNWHFTSELRYFFQYHGGETLTFFGDDDVWVFVNGRLAVDIGGIHGTLYGRVVLGDDGDGAGSTESNCTQNATGALTPATCALQTNEVGGDDKRFGLTIGKLYEIVVFQAERHPTGSNYQLTLDGFLAPRSSCTPICGVNPVAQGGGSTVTPPEECDDGAANVSSPAYGKCNATTCTLSTFCGDTFTNGPEQCDDGANTAQYGQSGCAPGCVNPGSCGDNKIDTPFEECDLGGGNTVSGYNGCTTNCELGPTCGDGSVNGGTETCDDGANDGSYGGCMTNCTPAPKCGDGNTDSTFGEACDGGAGCDSNCQLKCGNGDLDAGEECDDGINAGGYNRCGPGCLIGDYCGDGTRNGPEECDDGTNDGGYEECAPGCKNGPRCGDGIENGTETCDDGLNDNFYGGCTMACTPGPSCGDSAVQLEFGEECDDALTPTTCENCHLLGTCGDSITQNPPEECDDGTNDGGYGQCGPGCLNGPRCGDGVIQTPQEKCDEGTGSGKNKGGYGKCTSICQLGPYCGDGSVNGGGEVCDDGVNDEFYGSCTTDCKGFGPRCGDNKVQEEWGEECDSTSDPNCKNCRLGAQCGDKVVQSGEECDDGTNDGGYGQCGPSCKYGPRCGDGVTQKDNGEQCDNGEGKNTGAYGGCEITCRYAAHCGDGKITKPFEECDDKNTKNGDGCSSACKKETQIPR